MRLVAGCILFFEVPHTANNFCDDLQQHFTMAPKRKRQKLQEDGDAVAIALADVADEYHNAEADDADLPVKSSSTKSSSSLFIRSLPKSATTESLAEFFSDSYPVKHATVVTDRSTKESKGFGFVTFTDPDDAIKAKEEFNGLLFDGRRIEVDIAEPRHRDGQDSGGNVLAGSTHPKVHKKSEESAMVPRLIIRNLPWSFKKPEQLINLFQSYGKVKQASLPTQEKGLSSGFGFVLLRGRKNAEKAIAGLNGKVIDGRTITVDWAMDKDTWVSSQTAEKRKRQVGESDVKQDLERNSDVDMDNGVEQDGLELRETTGDLLEEASDSLDRGSPQHEDEDENEGGGGGEEEEEGGVDLEDEKPEDYSGTLFVRNLPFTATDESLFQHFLQFGSLRYARVVMDHETDRSRGTGFVCFRKPDDALSCLREAPKSPQDSKANNKRSVLEDTQVDPLGHYTLDGRVLQISKAVDRTEAQRLATEGQSARETRDRDKRRLFLLSEGTVSTKSPLHSALSQTELKMREDSTKQRQMLIKSNPSLHLSLTRLSIRNIPRHITSKDLKALAREAVVGFATDVKEHRRLALTKEELSRGGEEMKQAEHDRKVKGKGVVKQAKIVFEGQEGSKVSEKSGAGKSRGYGFVEYSSHRWALMGLRWLNGHLVKRSIAAKEPKSQDVPDRPRRLIVEFAIENAQVVARRHSRQQRTGRADTASTGGQLSRNHPNKKRKAEADSKEGPQLKEEPMAESDTVKSTITGKMIGKKRAIRKARKSAK